MRDLVDDQTGAIHESVQAVEPDEETLRILHKTTQKVGDDTAKMDFNTAISAMMIFVNQMLSRPVKARSAMETFVLILSPYAPHIAEELWMELGYETGILTARWPQADPEALARDEVEIVIQVNGRVRGHLTVPSGTDRSALEKLALDSDQVQKYL
mgnify:CR=1 FL=1